MFTICVALLLFSKVHISLQYLLSFFNIQLKNFFVCTYLLVFVCPESLLLCRLLSSCGEQGPLSGLGVGLFTVVVSPVVEHELQGHKLQWLQHMGSVAVMRRLGNCGARTQLLLSVQNLPRPGIEPMSLALAGRLFTIESPGRPLEGEFLTTREVSSVMILKYVHKFPGTPSFKNQRLVSPSQSSEYGLNSDLLVMNRIWQKRQCVTSKTRAQKTMWLPLCFLAQITRHKGNFQPHREDTQVALWRALLGQELRPPAKSHVGVSIQKQIFLAPIKPSDDLSPSLCINCSLKTDTELR